MQASESFGLGQMVDFDGAYGLEGSSLGEPGSGGGVAVLEPRAAIDDDKDEDEAYFEGDDELDDDEEEFDEFDEFDDDDDDDVADDGDDDEDEEL